MFKGVYRITKAVDDVCNSMDDAASALYYLIIVVVLQVLVMIQPTENTKIIFESGNTFNLKSVLEYPIKIDVILGILITAFTYKLVTRFNEDVRRELQTSENTFLQKLENSLILKILTWSLIIYVSSKVYSIGSSNEVLDYLNKLLRTDIYQTSFFILSAIILAVVTFWRLYRMIVRFLDLPTIHSIEMAIIYSTEVRLISNLFSQIKALLSKFLKLSWDYFSQLEIPRRNLEVENSDIAS